MYLKGVSTEEQAHGFTVSTKLNISCVVHRMTMEEPPCTGHVTTETRRRFGMYAVSYQRLHVAVKARTVQWLLSRSASIVHRDREAPPFLDSLLGFAVVAFARA